MKKYNYVYKITNLVNDKIYIGKHSTNNLDDGYMGSGKLLHKAYKKYGLECFTKEVIDYYSTEVELNQGEIYWIDQFNSTDPTVGYNLTYGGDGGGKTEEVRRKIGEARKGKTFSAAHKNHKPLSEETKRKISEALKGKTRKKPRPFTEEHRRKMSEAHKGVPRSEETKRKMSASKKGKPSPMYGKRHSEETKQKMCKPKKKNRLF